MNVNRVYAEEIAKWEGAKSWSGDKATKPFTVLWDDPESGADLKVVYRTPKEEGVSLLLLGFATCVVLAAITALLCRAFQPMHVILIGGPLILAFAVFVVVRAMPLDGFAWSMSSGEESPPCAIQWRNTGSESGRFTTTTGRGSSPACGRSPVGSSYRNTDLWMRRAASCFAQSRR